MHQEYAIKRMTRKEKEELINYKAPVERVHRGLLVKKQQEQTILHILKYNK